MSRIHHGMMADLFKVVEKACDGMKTGSESLNDWPAMNFESDSGRETILQHTFGRLFDQETDQPLSSQISELASTMQDDLGEAGDGVADAGIAFLGQFIDHDLTLDATTKLAQDAGDVDRIRNFRTPRLDLDCVYGDGPEVNPFLYGHDGEDLALIFGTTGEFNIPANPQDLQRNRNGRALVGDPRNDENLFVSQVHGRQFVRRHNEILANTSGVDEKKRYQKARAKLTNEYQRRIVEEFLPSVVDSNVLEPLMNAAKSGGPLPQKPINWSMAPDMPVEFSAAAFRFGHSMIRQNYALNDDFQSVEVFSEENMGFSPVAKARNLDFDLFFGRGAQKSRAINTKIASDLIRLPSSIASNPSNLAERNMLRGQITFRLPTGEALAKKIAGDAIDPHPMIEKLKLIGKTPLWFYVLWEAENHNGKLGPVGGNLVAGTLLNLMLRDPDSIFNNGYFEDSIVG